MKKYTKKNTSVLIYMIALALVLAFSFTLLTACDIGGGDDKESTSDNAQEVTDAPTSDGDTDTSAPGVTTEVTTEGTTGGDVTTDAPATSDTVKDTETTAPVVTQAPETSTGTGETTQTPGGVTTTTSGSFSADTGTSLGFRVDWKLVKFEGDNAIIEVDVILSCYELYLSARNDNLGLITIGNESVKFGSERIEQSEGRKVDIVLTTKQLTVKTEGGSAVLPIEAKWFFNGSYAGTDYEWMTASGVISVSKN